jgi:hypothetical protein
VPVTNGTNDAASAKPVRTRKVIHATCTKHGGSRGFTNVVLTKRGSEIELDPHATGSCVITFDEDAAGAVRDTITEWLR